MNDMYAEWDALVQRVRVRQDRNYRVRAVAYELCGLCAPPPCLEPLLSSVEFRLEWRRWRRQQRGKRP